MYVVTTCRDKVKFHGETALRRILKFQGQTANFSEEFRGEIAEFLKENVELCRQNLKILGRNTHIPGESIGFPGEIFHYFSQKKAVDHGKIKSGDFSLPPLYVF